MELAKLKREKVDDYYERLHKNGYIISGTYQGVTIDDVTNLLVQIGRFTNDLRDTVWCLLNNEFPSLFPNVGQYTISDGATVSHIGGYIGILLRGGKRLDREGRDYWIKPLREIGVIEEITLSDGNFVTGHIKTKSPNSAYRLSKSFILLLQKVGDPDFESSLKAWISTESINNRLQIYSEIAKVNKDAQGASSHKELIYDSIKIYGKQFLPGYIQIFVDAEDGNRITSEELALLEKYQINFGNLDDVWPDAILYNPALNSLWFIEAVTSDGEVDEHKMNGLLRICKNSNMELGGATTTYLDWKRCAVRQKKENNIALNTYIWIKETPDKHFKVE
ncbi:hypothetical protein LGL08_00090 [Clostridium estertheticum]|uniref:BsuBI/PstI family type II restriction endonuclease n=1 Tax=Clostridium estertheticum TaxID=238834 RepID=UPI001CF55C2A|nr:BsuBI/PstI family type II restriction endonuclease [Clostridium estertheticum]MCB2305613.1 hypothetical protein [Clostridium estertheticum]MCB2344571.1 hypothetical protein [Clostridium estertheticum]MCB2347969.1 hypothetical protein [Clostridium estertheticum]WAG45613.1 hypothetical protein LL127_19170 [Clostridium estertheticum]